MILPHVLPPISDHWKIHFASQTGIGCNSASNMSQHRDSGGHGSKRCVYVYLCYTCCTMFTGVFLHIITNLHYIMLSSTVQFRREHHYRLSAMIVQRERSSTLVRETVIWTTGMGGGVNFRAWLCP